MKIVRTGTLKKTTVTSKISSKTVISKIISQYRHVVRNLSYITSLTVFELTKIPQYWPKPQDNLHFTSYTVKFVKLEKCRRLDEV